MNILKSFFDNQNNIRKMMQDNKEDIRKANKRMLVWLLMLGLLCFSLLFVMTFFADDYGVMKIPYGCINLLLIAVLFVNRYIKVSSLLLLYGSYIIIMGVAVYASAFLTWDSLSVLGLIILFQIPIVILDRNRNIHLLEGACLVTYIFFMICFKSEEQVIDECVNVIIASIMGTILGAHLRYAQIENFNLKRIAVIKENMDVLTGLNNRRKLFDVLEHNKQPIVGIIMVDIDDFKAYNDTYGHQAGDKCLIKVSHSLSSISNDIDFYRYGGEEFVGIAYQLNFDELIETAKRCVKEVYDLQVVHEHSSSKVVTISMGLYVVNDEVHSNDDMIYYADAALYHAKHHGKNKVCIYKK